MCVIHIFILMYIDILVSIPVTHQCAYVYEYLFTSITMSVCVYLLACTHVCVYWHTQAHTHRTLSDIPHSL